MIKSFLLHRGYDVLTACDGKEALNVINATPPDLMVLDLAMPTKDGFDVYAEIFTHNGHPKFPVIVMTAYEELKGIFSKIGTSAFLSKPFELEELLNQIRMIFHKAEQPQVLLIDRINNPCTAEIAGILKEKGYVTAVVETVANVKKMLHATAPDFILMEYLQEEIPGDELIRVIRETQSQSPILSKKKIWVVVYSYSGMDYREKSLRASADQYLGKPVSIEAFVKAIHVCEIQKKQEALRHVA